MGKYIFAAILLMVTAHSLFAQTCADLFQKKHPYFHLGKDIQINILDLADSLSIYPNHKGMGSEWSRYVVGKYQVDGHILYMSMGEIALLENSALKTYAMAVSLKFVEDLKERHRDIVIDQNNIHLTLIFNYGTFNSGSPLAAKITVLKDKAYFDNTAAKIQINPFSFDSVL